MFTSEDKFEKFPGCAGSFLFFFYFFLLHKQDTENFYFAVSRTKLLINIIPFP